MQVLDKRHYDVQLMGGIVLHRSAIAEMKTGEGKTFVAARRVPQRARRPRGPCHHRQRLPGQARRTVDRRDLPSARDERRVDPARDRLHLRPGFPAPRRLRDLRPVTRREAYEADVTYGTNNELGFDFLRDNLVVDLASRVQRSHFFAIVIDEVDNILTDEGAHAHHQRPGRGTADKYQQFARLVPRLRAEEDYVVDEKFKQVAITEAGTDKMESWLGVENMFADDFSLARHLEQALKVLYQRDRDYVMATSSSTSSPAAWMPGRRWSRAPPGRRGQGGRLHPQRAADFRLPSRSRTTSGCTRSFRA